MTGSSKKILPISPRRVAGDSRAALTVRIADDREAWDAFVLAHPDATVAHLWEWALIIRETYGHHTHHLVASDATGLAGILPLTEVRSRIFGQSLCSLPYLDYGGVLATCSPAWSGLVTAAAEIAVGRRIQHLDLRQSQRPALVLPVRSDKVTLVLDLAGGRTFARAGSTTAQVEGMWQAIGAKTRNQVRKAEKSGLAVEQTDGRGVRDFYRVWRVNMRDLGSPAHSERWFEALFAHLGGRAQLYLVRRGAEVVGGLVALTFRDTVVVPWASSDRRYFSMSPNNLLYWTAIRDAILAGRRAFDFGRSSVGSGTYHFKRQWGATAERLYWQEFTAAQAVALLELLGPDEEPPAITGPPAGTRGRALAERIWRHLPVPVATWAGSRLRGGITL